MAPVLVGVIRFFGSGMRVGGLWRCGCGWAGWAGGVWAVAAGLLNSGRDCRGLIHAPQFLAWNCSLAWARGRPVDKSAKWGSGVLSNAALAGWWNRSPPSAKLHDHGPGEISWAIQLRVRPAFRRGAGHTAGTARWGSEPAQREPHRLDCGLGSAWSLVVPQQTCTLPSLA